MGFFGKIWTGVKITAFLSVCAAGGFVGYRKRLIAEMEHARQKEIGDLQRELEKLGPYYKSQLGQLQKQLDDLTEKERVKVTLWEDRLKRFADETAEFAQFKEIVPAQLKELENIGQMYWMAVKVLHDNRENEQKFEALCKSIHRAVFAGSNALFAPDSLKSPNDVLAVIKAIHTELPDPMTDALRSSVEKLVPAYASLGDTGLVKLDESFCEGLRLIECSGHSIAGATYNSFAGRLFSKAHYSLTASAPATNGTTTAPIEMLPTITKSGVPAPPKRINSEADLKKAIAFASEFTKMAKGGSLVVPATRTPIARTPEGKDAISHVEKWISNAQAHVALRANVGALNAYLTALCMKLGFPELPQK